MADIEFSDFISFNLATITSRASTIKIVGLGDNGFGISKNIQFSLADLTSYVTGSLSNAFLNNGNSFSATAKLGTNDSNSLIFRTNNTDRNVIFTNGRQSYNHLVDNGYQFDFNGAVRFTGNIRTTSGQLTFDNTSSALGIKIQNATSFNTNIDIGFGNTITTNRVSITGKDNTTGSNSFYSAMNGYNNNMPSLPTESIVNGFFNTSAIGKGGTGGVIIQGSRNTIQFATNAQTTTLCGGNFNDILHGYCSIWGSYNQTSETNELLFGMSNPASNLAGNNYVYFGTGNRSRNANLTGSDVYICGAGAGSGTDKLGGKMTIRGSLSTGAGAANHVAIATATQGASGTLLQTATDRFIVKGHTGHIVAKFVSTYADNAAAITAGLEVGTFYYRTGHGLDIVI